MNIIKFPGQQTRRRESIDSCQTDLTLPVCPKTNYRLRFAPQDSTVRSVPPVTAVAWLREQLQQGIRIKNVNIAGPGEPLNNPGPLFETVKMVAAGHPDIGFVISTIGIHGEEFAADLAASGVRHVTLLVDSVASQVAAKLYIWVRPERKTVPLPRAIPILLDEQKSAVAGFKKAGLTVMVQTTVYPGYNDDHVEEIAENMVSLGADAMCLVPFSPSVGLEDESPPRPHEELMRQLQARVAKHLPLAASPAVKEECAGGECGAGTGKRNNLAALPVKPSREKPNVAVVSAGGMDVDLHLGQACQVLIYGPREDGLACLLGTRPVPEPGSGSARWEQLAETLNDCFAVLALSAGESPRRILAAHGITVLLTDGEIEGTVDVLFGGGKRGKSKRE